MVRVLPVLLLLLLAAPGCQSTVLNKLTSRWGNKNDYADLGAHTPLNAAANPRTNPDEQPTMTPQQALAKAQAAEIQGNKKQAKEYYELTLTLQPTNTTAHHRLGVLADQKGDFPEAERHYITALQQDGKNPDLLNDLAYSYLIQKRTMEARPFLESALRVNPNHAPALNNLGLFYAQQGQYEAALETFRRVGTDAEAQKKMSRLFPSGPPQTPLNMPETQLAQTPTGNNSNESLEVQRLKLQMEQARLNAEQARHSPQSPSNGPYRPEQPVQAPPPYGQPTYLPSYQQSPGLEGDALLQQRLEALNQPMPRQPQFPPRQPVNQFASSQQIPPITPATMTNTQIPAIPRTDVDPRDNMPIWSPTPRANYPAPQYPQPQQPPLNYPAHYNQPGNPPVPNGPYTQQQPLPQQNPASQQPSMNQHLQALRAGMNAGPGSLMPVMPQQPAPGYLPTMSQVDLTPDYLYSPAEGPPVANGPTQSGFGPVGNTFPQQQAPAYQQPQQGQNWNQQPQSSQAPQGYYPQNTPPGYGSQQPAQSQQYAQPQFPGYDWPQGPGQPIDNNINF